MRAVKHSLELTHILYDLGRFVLFVGLLYAVILLMLKLATRSDKSGKRKLRHAGNFNRQQRRQEQAMKRHKRQS